MAQNWDAGVVANTGIIVRSVPGPRLGQSVHFGVEIAGFYKNRGKQAARQWFKKSRFQSLSDKGEMQWIKGVIGVGRQVAFWKATYAIWRKNRGKADGFLEGGEGWRYLRIRS